MTVQVEVGLPSVQIQGKVHLSGMIDQVHVSGGIHSVQLYVGQSIVVIVVLVGMVMLVVRDSVMLATGCVMLRR